MVCCTSSCYDPGTPGNTLITWLGRSFFNLFKSSYSEAEDRLPNDFSLFPVKLAFYQAVTLAQLDKVFGQILGGLPCCAPAREEKEEEPWLKTKQIDMKMFLDYIISHCPKQNQLRVCFGKKCPSSPCMNNILNKTVEGHNLNHVKQQYCRD